MADRFDLINFGKSVVTTTGGTTANVNIDANTLFIDGTNNRVGVGTNAPTAALQVAGDTSIRGLRETVFPIVDGVSVDIDPSNGTIQTWTLGASRTPTTTNFAAGQSVTLMILDGTAFTVTWTSMGVTWVGGSAPSLDTTLFTVIQLWRVGTTTYGALVGYV